MQRRDKKHELELAVIESWRRVKRLISENREHTDAYLYIKARAEYDLCVDALVEWLEENDGLQERE